MDGNIKFYSPTGPAFNPGEIWIGSSGSKVEIISVSPYPVCTGKWDYQVTYKQSDGTISEKDAWNFQVRYQHRADTNLK